MHEKQILTSDLRELY